MFRKFSVMFAVCALSFSAFAGSWAIDPTHSEVGFEARHMLVSRVHGQFKTYTADITFDEKNPAGLAFNVTIDVASIDTRVEQRDKHLQSPDFFDAATFPKITFKSTKTEVVSPGKFKITGDLTIRDKTKSIVLDLVGLDQVVEDGWGNYRAGATITGSINRQEFGLSWDKKMPAGDLVVSDKVDLIIQAEINKKKEAAK